MSPKYPVIRIFEGRSLDIIDEARAEPQANWLALYHAAKGGEDLWYDCAGRKWQYTMTAPGFRPNWLVLLAANTFYNPRVKITEAFEARGSFALNELKVNAFKCLAYLETDLDEADLKKTYDALESASNFYEVLKAIRGG